MALLGRSAIRLMEGPAEQEALDLQMIRLGTRLWALATNIRSMAHITNLE